MSVEEKIVQLRAAELRVANWRSMIIDFIIQVRHVEPEGFEGFRNRLNEHLIDVAAATREIREARHAWLLIEIWTEVHEQEFQRLLELANQFPDVPPTYE